MANWLGGRLIGATEDRRSGSRILTRSPGFAASAALLIALVIGGNTTIYTIVRRLTNNPAPGVRSQRLIALDNGAGFASPQDLWDALFRWWPPPHS